MPQNQIEATVATSSNSLGLLGAKAKTKEGLAVLSWKWLLWREPWQKCLPWRRTSYSKDSNKLDATEKERKAKLLLHSLRRRIVVKNYWGKDTRKWQVVRLPRNTPKYFSRPTDQCHQWAKKTMTGSSTFSSKRGKNSLVVASYSQKVRKKGCHFWKWPHLMRDCSTSRSSPEWLGRRCGLR